MAYCHPCGSLVELCQRHLAPSTNRDILGFNSFAEIGGGLRLLAPDVIRGVQGGTVRASAIVGPGVTGWLVSAALDF